MSNFNLKGLESEIKNIKGMKEFLNNIIMKGIPKKYFNIV